MREVTPALLALLCFLGQARGFPQEACGVDARPHPKGICGETLVRLRRNLCALLAIDYPHIFSTPTTKRSVIGFDPFGAGAPFGEDDLFSGGELLGNLDDGAREVPAPQANKGRLFSSLRLSEYRALAPRPWSLARDAASRANAAASRVNGAYAKRSRSDGELTHVEKRGLVCDCCFNRCTPRALAHYC